MQDIIPLVMQYSRRNIIEEFSRIKNGYMYSHLVPIIADYDDKLFELEKEILKKRVEDYYYEELRNYMDDIIDNTPNIDDLPSIDDIIPAILPDIDKKEEFRKYAINKCEFIISCGKDIENFTTLVEARSKIFKRIFLNNKRSRDKNFIEPDDMKKFINVLQKYSEALDIKAFWSFDLETLMNNKNIRNLEILHHIGGTNSLHNFSNTSKLETLHLDDGCFVSLEDLKKICDSNVIKNFTIKSFRPRIDYEMFKGLQNIVDKANIPNINIASFDKNIPSISKGVYEERGKKNINESKTTSNEKDIGRG